MSCPVAPISAYLFCAFHVSLVTRHSGGGGGAGGGDRYQDPWYTCICFHSKGGGGDRKH